MLEWIYYTLIKGMAVPERKEEGTATCPLSGKSGNADDCPGAKAKKAQEEKQLADKNDSDPDSVTTDVSEAANDGKTVKVE